MTVHVLNYAPRLPRMLTSRAVGGGAGGRHDALVSGSGARWLLLAVSLAVGVGVAAVTMHISSYWGFSL